MLTKKPDPATSEGQTLLLERLVLSIIKEQRSRRRWGIFFKLVLLLIVFFLWSGVSHVWHSHEDVAGPHTAEVTVNGVIGTETQANAEDIIHGLQLAFSNPQTQAVVLKINSPGGSPVQSEEVYQAIKRLRVKYPNTKLYAVCEDICTSGAYYMASSADDIYTSKMSLVGSIGVIMEGFGFTNAMKKVGIDRRVFTAGKDKDFMDPFRPLKPSSINEVNQMLKSVHQVFVSDVKEGRGDRLKKDPQLFSGMAWTGIEAKSMGLVDGFGSDITVAHDIVKAPIIIDYTVVPNPFYQLGQRLGSRFAASIASYFQQGHWR